MQRGRVGALVREFANSKQNSAPRRVASSQKGIEPGQGGGRLMGLDGQPSPPNPRPSDSAKTPSVPRGGVFLLGAKPEPCRWKWSVFGVGEGLCCHRAAHPM